MENRVTELGVAAEVTDARNRDLKRDYYPMDRLIEDLTTARAEVKEYQQRHAAFKERVITAERRLAELQGASTSSQGPQWTTLRE